MPSAASLVIGRRINLLGAGCSQSKPAYSPAQAKACAAIEAEYMSRVLAACPGRDLRRLRGGAGAPG
jgi:hypothetical protein